MKENLYNSWEVLGMNMLWLVLLIISSIVDLETKKDLVNQVNEYKEKYQMEQVVNKIYRENCEE